MQVISGRFSHLEGISSLRWVENIENQLKKKIYPEIKTEVQVSNFFKKRVIFSTCLEILIIESKFKKKI